MKKMALMTALLSGALLAQSGRLANGVYAVANPGTPSQNLVKRQFEGKDLVLDTANFAPLVIEGKPEVNRGPRDSGLAVQLAPEAARRLEDLTRSQINRTIAIVVGDRILSAPLVRSVITGGKARLTPCEDASCETLLRELTQK